MKTLLFTLFFTLSHLITAQQDTAVDYCKSGEDLIKNYQFQSAITALDKCYQQDSANTEYLQKIAFCYNSLGNLKAAETSYSNLIEVDSLNISAKINLAGIYVKMGDFNKAVHQFIVLLKRDSTNSYYHKQIAGLYLKKNSVFPAINGYFKCLKYNPTDLEAIYGLSELLMDVKQFAKADSLVDVGLNTDADNIKLLLIKGKIAYAKKDYGSVIEHYDHLLKLSKDTALTVAKLYGVSGFHLQKYDKSIVMLNKVLNLNAESEVIHYYLGLVYKSMGNMEKSNQHFHLAVRKGTSENLSAYYTNLGVNYEEEGDYKNAIHFYQEAYKYSENKLLLYHLARNYDAWYKDKQTALKYYEKYLASNDTVNSEYYNYSEHRISEIKKVIHFDGDTL